MNYHLQKKKVEKIDKKILLKAFVKSVRMDHSDDPILHRLQDFLDEDENFGERNKLFYLKDV
jgi:hypothetical protein